MAMVDAMTLQAGANQPPLLEPYDLFGTDPVLGAAMEREGAQREVMASFGKAVGSQEVFEWGSLANRHSPELATHDRFGNRIDEVRYHPVYHSLLGMSVSAGIHCMRYESQPGDGGVVTRNALMYLMSQVEVGHGCPTSMTSAALGALEHQPELAATWRPRLVSRSYDPRLVEPSTKAGCLIDMVNSTRVDVAIWAVSLMRQSVAQAGWHVAHRSAFGAKLIDKPLMVNVLADMELEAEAATLMMAQMSGAFDRAPTDPDEASSASAPPCSATR